MYPSTNSGPTWLLSKAKNVYSQFGEDGILEAALQVLPSRDNCCVEFGAWDGLHLSNTANLIRNHGYRGVFIEGDAAKVIELKQNYANFSEVTAFCQMVGWNEDDCLDAILAKTDLATDFDLLSIDIDGNDYYAWKACKKYTPKLVIIEFNQTIPVEVDYCQPCDPSVNVGASIIAIVRLAKAKGYELIAVLRNNLLFVRSDLFQLYGIHDNRPGTLRVDNSEVTWIFSGYDGSLHLAGCQKLPWHGFDISAKSMQLIPAYLRKFPPYYNSTQQRLARTLRWWRRRLGN